MAVERFAVLRHGDFDVNTGRMSSFGRMQMEKLGDSLPRFALHRRVRLILSDAPRATDGREVLVERLRRLNVNLEVDPPYHALWTDRDHPMNPQAVNSILQERSADVGLLIVLTHAECADEIQYSFGQEVMQAQFEHRSLRHGEGIVIYNRALTAFNIP